MRPLETAVVVPVPEAEPLIGGFREQLGRPAVEGVPAHVTVLYPFLPPDRIGPQELRRLGAAVASVRRFAVTFRRIDRFGDTDAWLAPEPAAGFRALTSAVTAAFPGYPPYRGEYGAEPVPHLTLGASDAADRLRAAVAVVAARLPVDAAIGMCHLLQGRPGPGAWRRVAELPLG